MSRIRSSRSESGHPSAGDRASAEGLSCPDCGAPMELRRRSRWGPFYGCLRFPDCRGTHGAHEDGRPMGIPGDAATRAARTRAHRAIDMFMRARKMLRADAYRWLAHRLRVPFRECHIGMFDAATCDRVVAEVERRRAVPRRRRPAQDPDPPPRRPRDLSSAREQEDDDG